MKGHIRNIFPGGNTPQGFYSYYNDILPQRKAEKIFCIKGGPGTGKSTLMKEVGNHFAEQGEDVDFLWWILKTPVQLMRSSIWENTGCLTKSERREDR